MVADIKQIPLSLSRSCMDSTSNGINLHRMLCPPKINRTFSGIWLRIVFYMMTPQRSSQTKLASGTSLS